MKILKTIADCWPTGFFAAISLADVETVAQVAVAVVTVIYFVKKTFFDGSGKEKGD